MSEYYTVNEMYGEKFYQIPKVLFTNPLYKEGLSSLEKLAFGLLKDRFSLSKKNGWFDEHGQIYFVFTQENLMEIFDCSKQTASNVKKNLIKVGLLEVKKRGQGKTDLLYLKKPIVTESDIYKIDKAESVGAVEESKNQTSRSTKNRPLEVPKIDANDTDLKDIDFKDTKNLSIHNEEIESLLAKHFKNELTIDWIDGFYKIFDLYAYKLTTAAYQRIMVRVKKYKNQVEDIESYLITCVENELNPKQPIVKKKNQKAIREEMIPNWLSKNVDQESEPKKETPFVSKERKKAIWEQVQKLSNGDSMEM